MVIKLLVDVGTACAAYHDRAVRNPPCKRILCDEIWTSVGAKQKNAPEDRKADGAMGDVWKWTAVFQ